MTISVDDTGVHVPAGFKGAADVVFDGRRVWSFSVDEAAPEPLTVAWPKRLQRLLDGRSEVRIVSADAELFAAELQFGTSPERLSFVDAHGTPIMVDKWGLIQRPFESRRAAGVIDAMVEKAEEILEVMRRDCGFEGWISFGTLLGAARGGRAIGHDSDIDLCFLSEAPTPALMAADLWNIARALRRAGMRVDHRAASFVTVRFQGPDGSPAGIDIYTTFYLDGLLYETATVRAPVPRAALMPLGEIEFEGRMLPAPADPAALLEVSYGPTWRVPDSSFQHRPGPEVVDRFHDWFGTLMRAKREWTHLNTTALRAGAEPTAFAHWVAAQLDPGIEVLEVGAGSGADLQHYAAAGHRAIGVDYALPRSLPRQLKEVDRASVMALNLYDLRDVLTCAAKLVRRPGPVAVTAYRLLESLEPDGRDALWQLLGMVLRRGGRLYAGGWSRSPQSARAWRREHHCGATHSFSPVGLRDAVRAAGGRVVEETAFAAADRATRSGAPAEWRMIAEWPTTERRVRG